MKQKIFFLNFFLFFLLIGNIISTVNAVEYRMGVHKDQELIWKCNVCNKLNMAIIFGSDWDDSGIFNNLSQGKRMKWKINSVIFNETNININFSIWEWTSENVWGVKDNDSELDYFVNPSDYSQKLNFSQYSSFVPFLFPVPIGEYVGGLTLIEWYNVDNRVLPTLNVEISKDEILPGFPSKDIQIIAIYNDQGLLNSYKLYIGSNVVIVDISLDFLPFYVIPTLIGLTVIISLSIIFYIVKKRKTRNILK